MTQLAFDNLNNRTVTSAANFGSASDGVNVWAQIGQAYTCNVTIGGEGTVTGFTPIGYQTLGANTPADCELLVRGAVTATTDQFGFIFRSSGANNHYRAAYSGGTATLNISKNVAGTVTVLASTASTITINTFYWIRLRCIGTTFQAKIWQDGTAEPSAWTVTSTGDVAFASGKFGLLFKGNAAGDTISFDNFFAADYINLIATPASDSYQATEAFIPVDALSANDALLSTDNYSVIDALTANDSYLATGGFVPLDTLSANDSYAAGGIFLPLDALSAVDILSNTGTYIALDALSVVDALLNGDTALFVEALSASDILLTTETALFVDSLTVSDLSSMMTAPIPYTSVTWTTRDGKITWLTRDGNVTWKTRK